MKIKEAVDIIRTECEARSTKGNKFTVFYDRLVSAIVITYDRDNLYTHTGIIPDQFEPAGPVAVKALAKASIKELKNSKVWIRRKKGYSGKSISSRQAQADHVAKFARHHLLKAHRELRLTPREGSGVELIADDLWVYEDV